jgi:hypothetical protein
MKEVHKPVKKEGDKQQTARQIYHELRLMQEDPIKTCIGVNPGTGAVFFPYDWKEIYAVESTRIYPQERGIFSDLSTTAAELVGGRGGITEEDCQDGLTHIFETFVKPKTILEGFGESTITKNQLIITQTGKLCETYPETKALGKEELSVYTVSGIERFGQLLKVPHRIHEAFGTYDNFRNALGDVDTNGIDHYDPEKRTDDGEKVWNLFRRKGSLPELVEEATTQPPPKYPDISFY